MWSRSAPIDPAETGRPGKQESGTKKSPVAFFVLMLILFAPFPILANLVHVPGMPKNMPVTDLALAFVPALAAAILTYRVNGVAGVKNLLARVFDFKKIRPWPWYLPSLLLPVVALVATYALIALFGVQFQAQPAMPFMAALLFIPIFLLAAAGEELGWSGYVIEPLQQRWGALGGNLILGVIWWAMHFPSIIQSRQDSTLIWLGMVGALATRILWAWIFNNTHGSVCAVIIVHAVSNMSGSYVPSIPTSATMPVIIVFAIVVTCLYGPRTLTRKKTRTASS